MQEVGVNLNGVEKIDSLHKYSQDEIVKFNIINTKDWSAYGFVNCNNLVIIDVTEDLPRNSKDYQPKIGRRLCPSSGITIRQSLEPDSKNSADKVHEAHWVNAEQKYKVENAHAKIVSRMLVVEEIVVQM